jgi:hypothetical protein
MVFANMLPISFGSSTASLILLAAADASATDRAT